MGLGHFRYVAGWKKRYTVNGCAVEERIREVTLFCDSIWARFVAFAVTE
jgi:hypothetical protein